MDNCGAELAIVGPVVCCLPTTENVGFKHYPLQWGQRGLTEQVGLLGSAPEALRNKPLGDPKGYLKSTLDLVGDTNMPIVVGRMTGLWVAILVPRRE